MAWLITKAEMQASVASMMTPSSLVPGRSASQQRRSADGAQGVHQKRRGRQQQPRGEHVFSGVRQRSAPSLCPHIYHCMWPQELRTPYLPPHTGGAEDDECISSHMHINLFEGTVLQVCVLVFFLFQCYGQTGHHAVSAVELGSGLARPTALTMLCL